MLFELIVEVVIGALIEAITPNSAKDYYDEALEKALDYVPEIQQMGKIEGYEYLMENLEDYFAGYPGAYIDTVFSHRYEELCELIDDWEPDETQVMYY